MTSKFYNYLKLAQTATPYAKRIEQLSSRIFGEVARPTSAKSLKACC
ncbi:28S ribosomal protein S33 [Daphnia magna]|uniref:28S ribosomal protein S33 n=1 Tax=Daphnia magna TaxID=35525 RepID=A0A164GE13_9CRUS|nr:28S ribosomal protein S33 [Daphnia magna]